METIQNFINEKFDHEKSFKWAGWWLKDHSQVLYYACLHAESIIEIVNEYKCDKGIKCDKGNEGYINWREYGDDYGSLTSEATEALMNGESDCDREYRFMVRCAEAEWKDRGGYRKQFHKEIDPVSIQLMKEQ